MLDVDVDIADVTRRLTKLARFGADLAPLFRELRKPVLDDQAEHRKKQEGPSGAWPRRAESTLQRYRLMRRAGRRPPARILGRLPSANVVRIDRQRLSVESLVRWSGAHQGGRGRLPARMYLWISGRLTTAIAKVAQRELEKGWG
jgi:hypothetical protein